MSIQVSTDAHALEGGTKQDQTAYLATLLKQRPDLDAVTLNLETATWLQEVRDQAAALLQEQTFPTTRDEEWRFTDLSPLLQTSFTASAPPDPSLTVSDVTAFVLSEAANSRLVFINGVYAPHLSSVEALPADLVVGNLAGLQANSPLQALIKPFLAKQSGAEEVFTALNTASLADAAIVVLAKNQVLDTPLHLLFLTTAEASPTISQPRCLIVAPSGSSVTLVEEYVALTEGVCLTNAVTEIWVEANAQVSHTRIQRESQAAVHIGKTAVSQARDSRYTCHAISLGAKLSRHNLEVFQTGEQTETTLNGLTLIGAEQLADTHSTIAYTKPHGRSRQVHKCIVDDRARAVFNGKVFVPKAAQLTDAAQLNRNLLLSPKARIDTKPQLEIVADNVKCTHGATVSQLDAEEVFYLQSRGLDQATAQKLLTYGFAIEVIQQIPITSVQEKLAQLVKARAF